MTSKKPSQRYREVQVNTVGKEDLLLLLVDGGVRFAEGGLEEMEKGREGDRSLRNDRIVRAQKIVLELMSSLSPEIGSELYRNLLELYRFTFQRLFEGNARGNAEQVREGVQLLKQIRDMWREAVEKFRKERDEGPQRPHSNSTISVTG